jgi:hypothetical protein
MFIFYTIQSNALCFVYFSILAVKTVMDIGTEGIRGATKVFPHFKGAVTMTIAVTFLIYHFVLVPQYISLCAHYSVLNWQNILVHYFVPLMAVADWLLFDEKEAFRWFDPVLWLTIPISYFLFIILRARIGGIIEIVKSSYPYFFIDVDLIGWINVLKNTGMFIAGFLVLGYIIYLIDKLPSAIIKISFVRQNGQAVPSHLQEKKSAKRQAAGVPRPAKLAQLWQYMLLLWN